MKKFFLLFVLFTATSTFAQKYSRRHFDYKKLKLDTVTICDNAILAQLEKVFTAIDENNSAAAVKIAKGVFDNNAPCPQIYEVYGVALFRSGEWFAGVDMIESGIDKFGRIPELIKRRSTMSLEMAQLGTGQKNIDGNSVYKANAMKYKEDQFKQENLKSALNDLLYLEQNYQRTEEIFIIGKVYQLLKEYTESTAFLEKLSSDEEYKLDAQYNIAENYIALKQYGTAEQIIQSLQTKLPKSAQLYSKLADIKSLSGDKVAAKALNQKASFYEIVPSFFDVDYSPVYYDQIMLFAQHEKATQEKLDSLENVYKQGDNEKTIQLCLVILKMHTNHGNGVEERATEILAQIGKPCLDKVHKLFQTDVSTCTITNLADIMATVKDTSSWHYLKEYLPYIAQMPFTLIPPDVPEMMIKFNEDEGIKEILAVVQPLLEQPKNGDAFGGFGKNAYYAPLAKIDRAKIKTIAGNLNYTPEQLKRLEEELKDN
jgi:tetratricopeptide (TPR) repeat protein